MPIFQIGGSVQSRAPALFCSLKEETRECRDSSCKVCSIHTYRANTVILTAIISRIKQLILLPRKNHVVLLWHVLALSCLYIDGHWCFRASARIIKAGFGSLNKPSNRYKAITISVALRHLAYV